MKNIIQFGERVDGYSIPVLNEREIRASAGILFLGVFISLMLILFKGNFLPAKYFITFFLTDLIIRVFINPKFSPFINYWAPDRKEPGPGICRRAAKKFAWIIGIILAALMFIFLVIVNAYSPITGITCLVCLVFLFFESAFGICLGCKMYSMIYKGKAQYCPGEVCDAKAKQPIQKTSIAQLLIIVAFIAYVWLIVSYGNSYFSKQPYNLFGINGSALPK